MTLQIQYEILSIYLINLMYWELLKSSQKISHVIVELKTDASEISSTSIVRTNVGGRPYDIEICVYLSVSVMP